MSDIDKTKCPGCEKDNRCGMEAGKAPCWCSTLPRHLFMRAFTATKDRCFCRACVEQLGREREAC